MTLVVYKTRLTGFNSVRELGPMFLISGLEILTLLLNRTPFDTM